MEFFWRDYIPLEEAVELSGADEVTLKRLLHKGTLYGQKKVIAGRLRWMAHRPSLKKYFNKDNGFALDLPGPKLFLTRQGSGGDDFNQFWVMVHNYAQPTEEEEFSVHHEAFVAGSIHQAANQARALLGPLGLVVQVWRTQLVEKDGEITLEF